MADGLPPTLADYARAATAALPPGIAAWAMGGAGEEITLRRNEAAFDALPILPRVLQRSAPDTGLTLLGTRLAHPVLIAPMGWQRLVHPEAERALAAGATAQGARMVLSAQATTPLSEARAAGALCDWFQLYWMGQGPTLALAQRAADAGYSALMLTVDAPVAGQRPREMRAGFVLPEGLAAVNLAGLPRVSGGRLEDLIAAAPAWEDLAWLCSAAPLPVLVKGILHPTDATQAIRAGAAGIVVSNHGGRVLDGLPASIEALPAVAATVARRVPLLLDGGIRRGTDVLRALALGADAVMVGRPALQGLAVAGALGVAHVLRLLQDELRIAMALCGCATLDDIGPALIFFNNGQEGGLTPTSRRK
ncbi:alpha-hydroxy acid oxidase [Paracoccus sp. MC1862]|uniref:alpha-hydroxy acid oxidase n=1 Tax=Paracoccus sp. MC1862 TaxID=2760307 RepID=UPI0015FFBD19|nr:alpha-hydroxy acid oxidase [Paracoccus sp. MC1862]MBB1499585.1 alpha-hydroxy-acid oxidizing protein [Paracoccus sp. MC1862]QQO44203.1 alpha-hydroxy-acid oxidizing protein [Paracoccus sp. MC1862]